MRLLEEFRFALALDPRMNYVSPFVMIADHQYLRPKGSLVGFGAAGRESGSKLSRPARIPERRSIDAGKT